MTTMCVTTPLQTNTKKAPVECPSNDYHKILTVLVESYPSNFSNNFAFYGQRIIPKDITDFIFKEALKSVQLKFSVGFLKHSRGSFSSEEQIKPLHELDKNLSKP